VPQIILYFKKRPHLVILGSIVLIAIFLRTYQIVERFEFSHDADLYSWIVKDITVNHHFRLLGQLTSAPGIFIGPIFYYLLIPFFWLSGMDPIGASILGVFIGVFTILSYYFVLSKLFNKQVGLIAAFLHAVLLTTISFDRWIVPTIPTKLWAIWFLYCLLMICRGKLFILPLLGILIGLIWHIHIALIPSLLALPAAFFVSKKLPNKKQLIGFLLTLVVTSLPLAIFELRHNFQQTFGLIENFSIKNEGADGFYKVKLVFEMITKNINNLFFMPHNFKLTNNFLFIPAILLSGLLLIKIKLIQTKELIPLYAWFFGVFLFFALSSSPISEYYFYNVEIIFITLASLLFYFIFKSSTFGKVFIIILFGIVLVKNSYYLINQDIYHKGYLEKKLLVDYINNDAKEKGFPCIGISYITSPGENVGFRYFIYMNKMHLVHPSTEVPVYNIVLPEELSGEEGKIKFGHIGLIPPKNIPLKETIDRSCQTPDTNVTDSMFGYVE